MSSRLTSTSLPNQSRTTARVLGPAQPLWARVGATPRSNASKPNHAPKRSRFGTWRSKASAQMSLHNAVERPAHTSSEKPDLSPPRGCARRDGMYDCAEMYRPANLGAFPWVILTTNPSPGFLTSSPSAGTGRSKIRCDFYQHCKTVSTELSVIQR